MQRELRLGSTRDILTSILAMTSVTHELVPHYGAKITVSTDTSEIDRLRAEMNAEREKAIHFRDCDRILCSFQHKEYALGAWRYQLGTNIYGYAVGDSLRSNIGGGTWAMTPRGLTLSEAIVWGCNAAKAKNVTFSFSVSTVPDHLHRTLVELAHPHS